MADYKAIKGHHIESVSSDNATVQLGDIWYNSTLGKLRVGQTLAAWSSGNDANLKRVKGASAGIQTAAIIFGGVAGTSAPFNPEIGRASELYDGTDWTTGPDIVGGRQAFAGCGTTTATLAASGYTVAEHGNDTEEFDGSSWTETADLGTARYGAGVAGTQTAALCITGDTYPGPEVIVVEQYDGSSWTEIADVNTSRRMGFGFGTTTAALFTGGADDATSPQYTNANFTELWNGTSWTEVNNLNLARSHLSGGGISTAAIVFGGYAPSPYYADETESWDGTSWTEIADMSTGRTGLTGGGTATAAVNTGGYSAPENLDTKITEEFDIVSVASSVTVS